MKKIAFSLFTLLLVTTVSAQKNEVINGNGKNGKVDRKTAAYDKVKVVGFFDIDLVSGTEGNLTLEGDQNILDYIVTEVTNNTLTISTQKGISLRTGKNKLLITVPVETLDEISLVGSGDINSKSTIKGANMDVILAGSGDINLSLDNAKTNVSITGSGDIRLKGKTTDFIGNVSGSGDLSCSDFKAQNVEVSISGSGDAKVYASNVLKARVSGSGDIQYSGNPAKQDTKTSGSGSISKN